MQDGDYQYSNVEPAESARRPKRTRPKKRRRPGRLWRLGTVVSGLLTFSMIIVAAMIGALYFLKLQFDEPGPLKEEKTVIVTAGSGLSGIARGLERAGVVSRAELFMAGVMIKRAEKRLKAGEYRFEAAISMEDVLGKLIEGKSVKHKVTLAEGLTSEQIVTRLREHEVLIGDIEEVPAEGVLLPETYLFQRGKSRAELVAEMKAAQEKLIAELWPKRSPDIAVKTPQEALILASIVEKETGVASERPRIAAVFHNRLRKSMRLQSDPTIIYGIIGGKGALGRPIRRSEIDKKTPYNTYQIDGLPPTPIANPGRASIAAVLNPATTDDLYFVADGSGGHAFATSLSDHQKNVSAWRKISAEMRKKAAEEAAKADAASADDPKPAN